MDERAPMYHISGHGAPMQFIVCDDDMPARLEQNALMVQALKSFDYDSTLDFQIVKGISHGEFLDAAKNGHSHFFSACQRFVKAVIAG